MRRTVAAVAAALLALGAAACSRPSPDPTPSGSTPTPSMSAPGYGTRYALPESMCDVADFSAVLEVYPHEETDSVLRSSTPNRCDTGFLGDEADRGLGFSLFVILTEEELLAGDPTLTRQSFEAQRRLAMFDPTDVQGVGSGAFCYTDGDDEMWFEAYDGNLRLELYVFAVFSGETLAPGMADRLAAVVSGTLAALAP